MSLIDSIKTTFENLLVPRDGYYDQAKELMAGAGGGSSADVLGLDGGASAQAGALIAADNLGNRDGKATLKEVRAFLQPYDEAGDGRVDGAELLQLETDMVAVKPTAAARGAVAGAGLV